MPIEGDIKNLYSNKNKTRALFPITKVKAISDDNGVGLGAILDEMTVHTSQVGAPYNLLDNTNFKNPVNQRNESTYNGPGYTIDRWMFKYDTVSLTVNDSYIKISNTSASALKGLAQLIPSVNVPVIGSPITVVYKPKDRSIIVGSCLIPSTGYIDIATDSITQSFIRVTAPDANGNLKIGIVVKAGKELDLEWIAAYEGQYDSTTIPNYNPKTYTTELLQCQRYYYKAQQIGMVGYMYSASTGYVVIETPVPFRGTTTVTISEDTAITLRGNGIKYTVPITDLTLFARYKNQLRFKVSNLSSTNIEADQVIFVMLSGNIELSAELKDPEE